MPPKKKKARQSAPASSSASPSLKQVKQEKSSPAVTPSKQIRLATPVASSSKKGPASNGNGIKSNVKSGPPKRKQDSDDETDSEIEEGEVIMAGDKRRVPGVLSNANVAGPSSQRAVSAPQALPSKPALVSTIERLPKASAPVATTAALPPPPAWNNDEKKEAMRLIKDITSLGLKPMQLVEAGIRQDIVIACCRELNISMNGGPVQPDPRERLRLDDHPLITSQIARSPSPPFSTSIKIKSENESRAPSSSPAGLPAKPVWTDSVSIDHSQVNPRLLSKKARKAIQKKADQEEQKGRPVADMSVEEMPVEIRASGSNVKLEDDAPLASVAVPSVLEKAVVVEGPSMVEKMRLAALASMKRKKAVASMASIDGKGIASTGDSQMSADVSVPILPAATPTNNVAMTLDNGLPPNVPTGPRSTKPAYHDIDAPQMIHLEDDEEVMEAPSSSRFSDADPRQSRRSTYAEDYAWEADAPSGDVDLEAPLPSLETKSVNLSQARMTHPLPSRPARKRPLAADLMDMSGASTPEYQPRPRPFLSDAMQRQRLVLECSDDEDEESDENGKARQASTAFISQIYKQLNGSEDDLGNASRSVLSVPTPPNGSTVRRVSPSSSSADLSKKEQEIKEMMAKIQAMEKKRGQAPSDPRVLAEVVKATVEEAVQQSNSVENTAVSTISNGNNTQASLVPLYESPFSRYPGLRQVLQKE